MTQTAPIVNTAAHISQSAGDALVAAAVVAAKRVGIEASIAVVDGGGSLRSFTRTDRAPSMTANVAIAKAWTSATSGYPTHVWNKIVSDSEVTPLTQLPGMMAIAGGFPIMHEGQVVGAIGVGGGNAAQDQEVAQEALSAAGFSA